MNTKAIAIAAVLAVAMAALVVAVPLQAQDSAAGTGNSQPIAYADDGATGDKLRAILYEDKVLMVDLSEVASLADDNMYYVKLYTGTNDEETASIIGPVAAVAGKICYEVTGQDRDSNTKTDLWQEKNGYQLNVKVYKSDLKSQIGQSGSVLTLKPTYENGAYSPMSLKLNDNHASDWSKIKADGTDQSYVVVDRFAKQTMDETLEDSNSKTPFMDSTKNLFTLSGWATKAAYEQTDIVLGTDAIDIETLIYTAADNELEENGVMTFYAAYDIRDYTIKLADEGDSPATAADYTATETGADGKMTKVGLKLYESTGYGSDDVAEANVTAKVSADGFALLQVSKKSSTDTDQYAYELTMKKQGNSNLEDASADCTVETLATGVYKIYNVKADLLISIKTTKTEVSAEYDLYLDYVANNKKNDTTQNSGASGAANLSLSLRNWELENGSTLTLNGTIYRISDEGSIRIYSSLQDHAWKTNDANGVAGYTVYVDGVSKIGPQTGGKDTTETLNNNVLTLKNSDNADLLTEGGKIYDLSVILDGSYKIYAAQGLWNQDGNGAIVNTPWALADI